MDIVPVDKINEFVINYCNLCPSKQLEELKKNILESLELFRSCTVNINDDKVNKLDKLENYRNIHENKTKLVLTNGYEFISKIRAMLSILEISDDSQTNKYKYEECERNIFSISEFLNAFQDLTIVDIKDELNDSINLLKISQDKLSSETNLSEMTKVKSQLEKKNNMSLINTINIFNHYIGQLVLQMCKINLILKYTFI